ncbi:hypothetical protein LPJ53_003653 [Coemansia erecta]|uniref:BZIP domain-containing protein n=1 Tax=Coemansia erecta TaxID=147472 RepID=A0A9W8CS78_9FUNG|nr:hypothetical protein LPJ53_003653 [Coemansia erecta]
MQQQQPQSSPPPSSRRRARHQGHQNHQNHQSPQGRKSSLTRASVDHDDDVDSGELSPQSRRRHQSRQSSARLRERQRQRIHNAEEDVSKLEDYVRSLQQTIDVHRHQTAASGGPDILGAMEIMHPNIAQQQHQAQQCSGSNSDEEGRRNFDARVRQLILSLSEAMHQLGGCVERIDVLKQLLVGRIGLTEQALLDEMQQQRSSSSDAMSISPPPYSMTESNMRKHTSGNSPSNSGNNSGSNSGSSSNTLGGNSYATTGPPSKVAKTDGSSRIPISFLVDEEQADSSGVA